MPATGLGDAFVVAGAAAHFGVSGVALTGTAGGEAGPALPQRVLMTPAAGRLPSGATGARQVGQVALVTSQRSMHLT